MGERLYVFVDESGNHTQSDCFVVAGCWCITEYTDRGRILQATKNKISDNVVSETSGAAIGREIKGKRLSPTKLNSCIAYLRKIVNQDRTVSADGTPWSSDVPVRFTTYEADGDLCEQITRQYLSEGRSYEAFRVIGLAAIINPLLRFKDWFPTTIDSYVVVLDAETWQRPSTKLRRLIDTVGWTPEITFEIRDSEATPGIQLADIVAHTRRRWLLKGECEKGSNMIDTLRI